MRIRIALTNGDKLLATIDEKNPYAFGGEGNIYHFYHERYMECFLKIYKDSEKARNNRAKIVYLIRKGLPYIDHNIRYCWPIGTVYDEKGINFLGFVMRSAIVGSRNLCILTNHNIGHTLHDDYPQSPEWHKYELSTVEGLRMRLQVLAKLAEAVNGLHRGGEYCVVDLKPENIFITPDGDVSIIDIDSIQVKTNNVFHKATAFTPNYFPEEAYEPWKAKAPLDRSCDSFAFGVCAYMILTGTHPYNNVILDEAYEDCTTISMRIKNNLYYRGPKAAHIHRVSDKYDLHHYVNRLPLTIRLLFDRTFTNDSYSRPTMHEWLNAFRNITI